MPPLWLGAVNYVLYSTGRPITARNFKWPFAWLLSLFLGYVLPSKKKEVPPTALLMDLSIVNCSVQGTREVEGEGVNCVDAGLGRWELRFGEGFLCPFCRWWYHNCKYDTKKKRKQKFKASIVFRPDANAT